MAGGVPPILGGLTVPNRLLAGGAQRAHLPGRTARRCDPHPHHWGEPAEIASLAAAVYCSHGAYACIDWQLQHEAGPCVLALRHPAVCHFALASYCKLPRQPHRTLVSDSGGFEALMRGTYGIS